MKIHPSIMAGMAALSISAYAQAQTQPNPDAPNANNSAAPNERPGAPADKPMPPHPLTDAQIVQIVETTNDGEIAAARAEKNHGKSSDAKDFASMMIDQHTQNNKDLKELTKKLKMHPEKTPMSDKIHKDSEAEDARFAKMRGADLDRAYVDKQVELHQHVLDKLDHELIPQAKNDDLKALLQNTRTTVAEHLDHAKMIQKTVNGQTTTNM